MAILPNELLTEVCCYASVSTRTLKQLRLADRTMSAIASKFLFAVVEFILLPKSIENARNIMGHSTLRRHVKALRYFGERLNPRFADHE
jgi:hypothetical protein